MTPCWSPVLLAVAATAAGPAVAQTVPARDSVLRFEGKAPEGLVGNGRSVVRVEPGTFRFVSGGSASGRFRLVVAGRPRELAGPGLRAAFFPGGVEYAATVDGATVEVLHGATAALPYLAVIRVRNAPGPVSVEVTGTGEPAVAPRGLVPIPLVDGTGTVVVAAGSGAGPASYDEARRELEAPYLAGTLLRTPSAAIDRTVAFDRFLLDLGFDGRLHVCELFRWRDVWSRDLGSGLAPGAMVSGRFAAARTSLDYDLRRYATANPRGLKVTEDPSQGGSAEGTAWLARAVFRDYLLTGDRAFLERAAATLRPWVEAWLDRDPARTGLVVDVTEWMDHSRFLLFPDGARVLYSNVLLADLLGTFARVETELSRPEAARRLEGLRQLTVRAVNAALWDEASGEYANLTLWGRRDERSASAENALAVLAGVAPPERARRLLATVKATNWGPAGSTTITPPMTHVDPRNDHNDKVWPWWNAVEARARFRNGDAEGGVWLLERCAATLGDEHFPGLVEELLTPDGVTDGGHAFLTAAGSFLDAVFEGLLGVDVLEPGCARIRVVPHVPEGWRDFHATVPLPRGAIEVTRTDGRLRVTVTDPRVAAVEAEEGVTVVGAARSPLAPAPAPAPLDPAAPVPLPVPPPRPRTAATFAEAGIPAPDLPGLPPRKVGAEGLLALDPADVGALVVPGNGLPRRTRSGADVQAALARFLDRGGALVFFGATMTARGTMGETGGVVEWYERAPAVRRIPLGPWKVRASGAGPEVPREADPGLRGGWQRPDLAESDWRDAPVPGWWEAVLGESYDGWGWYRAHVRLPLAWRGAPVALGLGRVDDADWTYVNGVLAGSTAGSMKVRRYDLRPGEPAYEALRFGEDNVVAVQVLDGGGTGGLHGDPPTIGTVTGGLAWTPVDPADGRALEHPVRHGVVSWGPGDFFASWETSRGAFGFAVEGSGVRFEGPLASLPPLDAPVREAFTDFAVARPWLFEPLAFTQTRRGLLVPDRGERYPCAARLVNAETRGEIVLVPASVARSAAGPSVLELLGIRAGPVPR